MRRPPRSRFRLVTAALAVAALGSAGAASATTTTIPKDEKPLVTEPGEPSDTASATDTTEADSTGTTDAGSTDPTDTTEATATTGNEPGDGVVGTGDFDVDDLAWGPCDADEDVDAPSDCATLTAPLDYADPTGETIDIALIRYPATGTREGMILLNPGGPGGSGWDLGNNAGAVLSSELGLENFDIVGFDPRGVDRSGGISCLDDATQDEYLYLDYTPDTPEEQQLVDDEYQVFGDACREKYGDTLVHYSTVNTARDMDLIRQAAGDDQLSFLGISYGTYLGAVYASLFPDETRALVLDSAFEPTGDSEFDQYATQLIGFEGAFDNWATWCQDNAESCAFSTTDVGAAWDELRATIDDTEPEAADGRITNTDVLDTATISALYSEAEWPVLGQALADADTGDMAGIFRLADGYEQRHEDGTFDSLNQSSPVIRCASGLTAPIATDPDALLAELQEVAPRFAADYTAEDLTTDNCDALLTEPVEVFVPHYDGDAPILVVGGTADPATPFRWAEELTDLMGPSATLLQFNGEGHGQVLTSTCVTDFEAATLADLELPPAGEECDPDPDMVEPAWWQDIPLPDGIEEAVQVPSLAAGLGLNDKQYWYEVHFTDLGSQEALDAYQEALEGTDMQFLTNEELMDGVPESVYFAPGGEIFIVLAIDAEAFASNDDLEGLDADVPEGQTAVIIATFDM